MEDGTHIDENRFSPHKRGFDFSSNTNATAFASADGTGFNFGSVMPFNKDTPQLGSAGSSNINPFVFGAFAQENKCKNPAARMKFQLHRLKTANIEYCFVLLCIIVIEVSNPFFHASM